MRNIQNKTKLKYELISLWVLYFISFIVVYYLPASVKYPYFFGLLIFFMRSKKDYWWIAFFFILFAEIGGLFPFTARVEGVTSRIPVYSFQSIRIPYYDLYLITFFLKSLKKNYKYSFQNSLNFIGLYAVLLYFLSIIIGMTFSNHITTIRAFLSFTLFFSFPRFIKGDDENLNRFFFLVFSAIFVVISFQFIELFTGFKIGNIGGDIYKSSFGSRYVRLIYSPFLGLLCFTFGLYYFLSKRRIFMSKRYLAIVVILSVFSI